MASNITLSYFGPPEQKHVIKVPPMQTLSEALAAAASKFKPALVPGRCALQHNKKAVDLNTPFRLLNVPAGSKLEILISKPSQQEAPAAPAPAPAAATTPAPVAAQQPQQPQQVVAAAPQAPPPPQQQQQPAASPPAAAPVARQQQPQLPTPPPPAAAAGPSSSSTRAEAGPSTSNQAPAAPAAASASAPVVDDSPSPLAALGVQGQVYVFNQRALEAAAAAQGPSPMELDPPDDFFELTTEDLVRLQQQANDKKRQQGQFKPRSLRAAEAAARAATQGPVRVRLHFPDATILQVAFTDASTPLSAVQGLLHKVALPALAPGMYLYTTPPKSVIKDLSVSLYQAQLVPAAHIYVGFEPSKLKQPLAGAAASTSAAAAAGGAQHYPGPYLKPEVMALLQETVPESQQDSQHAAEQQQLGGGGGASTSNEAATAAEAQRVMAAAAAASRADAGRGGAAGGGETKVPKWLKMGK